MNSFFATFIGILANICWASDVYVGVDLEGGLFLVSSLSAKRSMTSALKIILKLKLKQKLILTMEVRGGKRVPKWIHNGNWKKLTLLWKTTKSQENYSRVKSQFDTDMSRQSKYVFNHIYLLKYYRNDNEKVIGTC